METIARESYKVRIEMRQIKDIYQLIKEVCEWTIKERFRRSKTQN